MWLYVPNTSTSSPSAPEAVGLISESDWRFPALAASAWWRGKPSPSRTWYQRWNRVSFIRLLCGAMCDPSTAAAGVDAWTASLAASRASRTALPGKSAEASMSATCGATPGASSSSLVRGGLSSKTSAGCSRRGLTKSLEPSGYGETFASLVSRLRSDCSRRRKSARAMNASASSSSAWLTPSANEDAAGTVDGKMQRMLTHQAKETSDLWSTPRSSDGEKGGPNQAFGAGGIPLPAQTAQWPTPTSLSFGDSHQPGNSRSYNETMRLASFLQAQEKSQVGASSSNERRSLNPLFVEWLMGWPPGWTLLAWTDFACSAMELSRYRQRMRSALSAIDLPREAPPAQLALFG